MASFGSWAMSPLSVLGVVAVAWSSKNRQCALPSVATIGLNS